MRRHRLIAALSLAIVGCCRAVSQSAIDGTAVDGTDAPLFDEQEGARQLLDRQMKRGKSTKPSKRGKKRSKKRRGKSPKPTPAPTSPPNGDDESVRRYTDGERHSITSEEEYKSIILENGGHLTIESGVTIEAAGMVQNRAAISVSDSSLKVQGDDILIVGSSYVHNEYGEYGGTAVSFLRGIDGHGSKGFIGCGDMMQPPPPTDTTTTTAPPPPGAECEVPATDLNDTEDCDEDEFCLLREGVCNEESPNHGGVCAKKPEVCPEFYLPVCGCDGRTYGNACEARLTGVSVSHHGKCDDSCPPGQCRNPKDSMCGPVVRCVADPCEVEDACDEKELCEANYCGGCHAVCSGPPIDDIPEPSISKATDCNNDSVQIIGGDGNKALTGRSGVGGNALNAYGQGTNVQINVVTLRGGDGSTQGYAMEIAEAIVTIYTGHIDGDVMVAKRGSLHIYGGTFTKSIEVIDSSVTFYGCFDRVETRPVDNDYVGWTFAYSGNDATKQQVEVLVYTRSEGSKLNLVRFDSCEESSTTSSTPVPDGNEDFFT